MLVPFLQLGFSFHHASSLWMCVSSATYRVVEQKTSKVIYEVHKIILLESRNGLGFSA
ncbi:hypothetical protein KC19_9G073100 [Ceratodon purpureus]|uniref:Uncharacterized protein n=1 Tax=Ceratodon purpureus TaxID=3225 RepID=A0A8T0GPN1_CERPU|nr:hypothetical protein KC19_9G073100 [Ceratodon purpureus]